MSLDSHIARSRQRTVDVMRDECTITRRVGTPVFDPDTGEYEQATITVYTGRCRVRSFTWEGSDVQAGQQEVRLQGARAVLPFDTPVEKDDVLTVSVTLYDSSLIGVPWRVTDTFRDGWQIGRVAILEEVT